MCHVMLHYDHLAREAAISEHARFFVVALTDGLATENELTLLQSFNAFASRLPLDSCFAAHFFLPDECREFKASQKLNGLTAPLLFVSEENPFPSNYAKQRAVIELGRLPTTDQVKQVLASIAEQAHDESFVKQAKRGEMLRKIERGLGKFGGPVKDCFTLAGFG